MRDTTKDDLINDVVQAARILLNDKYLCFGSIHNLTKRDLQNLSLALDEGLNLKHQMENAK